MRPKGTHSRPGPVCAPHDHARFCADLGAGAIYLTAPQADGTMDVYAAVPDGYMTASAGGLTAEVQNNAVWLHAVPLTANTLHLDGPNGSRDIDLGLQTPPSS